ncbi:GntR family transcriptional regulator [Puteibacter caeruleilacunae]|nr:GntR family transcriptional regulator [Puteibacter caeruleilacunae]
MKKNNITLNINAASDIPKFRQIIDSINHAIAEKKLNHGDVLPSVNFICKEYKLSRDTVFKAYALLKEQGVIESVPNKGYFVSKETRRVFLFLDTFKAYKEVLYGQFNKNLAQNTIADVHFHHYNIDVFRKLVQESVGKYSKYIIMPFDHPEVIEILSELPKENLLLIDWNIGAANDNNVLFQDFGQSVYDALEGATHLISKYKEFILLYPEFTDHPIDTLEFFEQYCRDNKINYSIQRNPDELNVSGEKAFFTVSDRMLGKILEQCKSKKLEPGQDVGILSYNETPMKKFIHRGISVISTDFHQLGSKAAEFASSDMKLKLCVPTSLIIRESL